MAKAITYRELRKRLQDHDSQFQFLTNRAKGSERMIYHPNINGQAKSYPVKCHGENTEIYVGHIRSITQRFKLPNDLLK